MLLNRYVKTIFIALLLFFGFLVISPLLRNMDNGTEIIFFGVGNADSMLIRNKKGTILIDSGLREDRETLAEKFRNLGVKKIDYMILTHPDKDHIGGASYILDNFNVKNLIQSKFKKGTKGELRIEESLENNATKNIIIEKDYQFYLGDLEVILYSPMEDSYEKSNDYSLITIIKDGELDYLFGADAEEILLGELLEREIPDIDLYKLPHHGKWNSNSEEMIKKISPQIGVITNKKADGRVISALEELGTEYYYVYDEDLYFYSDGVEIIKKSVDK